MGTHVIHYMSLQNAIAHPGILAFRKRRLRGTTVHVHTNNMFYTTLIVSLIYSFKYTIGAMWPILSWHDVKPAK